jgi:hypothetical protein
LAIEVLAKPDFAKPLLVAWHQVPSTANNFGKDPFGD